MTTLERKGNVIYGAFPRTRKPSTSFCACGSELRSGMTTEETVNGKRETVRVKVCLDCLKIYYE